MLIRKSRTILVPLVSSMLAACGGGGPDQLAKRVESAIASHDVDALVAATRFDRSPSAIQSMLLGVPGLCAGKVCTARATPLPAEWAEDNRPQLESEGVEYAVPVEGLIEVVAREPGETETAKPGMRMEIPYAQLDGEYRLVAPRLADARLAQYRALTAAAVADAALAKGIYDDQTGERDKEWRTKATPLPADGGEPGAAFLASVGRMGAAINANDPDAAMEAGDERIAALLAPVDYNGQPVSIEARRGTLRSQAMGLLVDAKVLGGWELGHQAVLVIEGTNGAGATVRGAQIMKRQDGAWIPERDDAIEIPKDA